MRFSVASASAVVLAAVSLVAAVDPCNLVSLKGCVDYTKKQNGGNLIADCGFDGVNQQNFNLSDPKTKLCLTELTAFYKIIGVPPECNDCLKKPVPV